MRRILGRGLLDALDAGGSAYALCLPAGVLPTVQAAVPVPALRVRVCGTAFEASAGRLSLMWGTDLAAPVQPRLAVDALARPDGRILTEGFHAHHDGGTFVFEGESDEAQRLAVRACLALVLDALPHTPPPVPQAVFGTDQDLLTLGWWMRG